MIANRLKKNFDKIAPWMKRNNVHAWRLYDRDIPEFPYIVDLYNDKVLVFDRSDEEIDAAPAKKQNFEDLLSGLKAMFPERELLIKRREKQKGESQYEKIDNSQMRETVIEGKARFYINLYDYLDTGLFLDHRPLRHQFSKKLNGKNFLNLFCYTGSVSVAAALGGATTTSVDMSATYIKWAQDNFKLNSLDLAAHSFINQNALEYLRFNKERAEFDIIFLDPPTFSNSKKMTEVFEVEKDQIFLVDSCMSMLHPNGVLYFSNNKRKFKLEPSISLKYSVKNITEATIPIDFHDKKIHHCFEIRHKEHI